jgi:hypothetical protein
MENFYRPPGGEPGDSQPTEQFWQGQRTFGPYHDDAGPRSGGPSYGGPRSGHHGQQPPGLQAHLAKDRHKALRWTVGLAVAALLAGGGALAGMSLTGNSLSSTPAANTGSTMGSGTGTGTGSQAGQAGQAALLAATLSAASAPDAAVSGTAPAAGTAPGTGTSAPGTGQAARRCAQAAGTARAAQRTGHQHVASAARAATSRCRFIRRRLVRFFLLHGVDGQFTFRTASGALKTLAYERGVIQSVSSGSSIVVKAADGTTWTWDLVAKTVVRDSSGKISASSLAAGEPVWVGGPVISGAKDARLIFVRPPGGTS